MWDNALPVLVWFGGRCLSLSAFTPKWTWVVTQGVQHVRFVPRSLGTDASLPAGAITVNLAAGGNREWRECVAHPYGTGRRDTAGVTPALLSPCPEKPLCPGRRRKQGGVSAVSPGLCSVSKEPQEPHPAAFLPSSSSSLWGQGPVRPAVMFSSDLARAPQNFHVQ